MNYNTKKETRSQNHTVKKITAFNRDSGGSSWKQRQNFIGVEWSWGSESFVSFQDSIFEDEIILAGGE